MKKKRIILFLLAFALLIALAACSKSEAPQGSEAAAVSDDQTEANLQREAELLAEAIRLQNEPSDDYVIQANDFSMSRALFENRVESVMLSGVSREEAEQNVLNYVVVQTLYHAALNAGVTVDEAQIQQQEALTRENTDAMIASDQIEDGSHNVKVFFDALEANGIVEDYWAFNTSYLRMNEMILAYTTQLHDNNYIGQGYSADDQAGWLQYCLDYTRGEMEAQNVQFAPDIQWELNGLNYHYYLWPEL